MKNLILILSFCTFQTAFGQTILLIENFEPREGIDLAEFWIEPQQWIGKELKIWNDKLEFELTGLTGFEHEFYTNSCQLLQPPDTFKIENNLEFRFVNRWAENYKDHKFFYEVTVYPNCYLYPIADFFFYDTRTGYFYARGIRFNFSVITIPNSR